MVREKQCSPSPRVLCIGDDLTGTVDVLAPLAGGGLAASVAFDWQLAAEPGEVDIFGVNTGSRHLPPGQAAGRVAAVLADNRDCKIVYKKTDSVLRGNLSSELGVLKAAFPEAPLFYVPAFPEAGRSVLDGRLFVDGVPVEETDFARDPLCPVHDGIVRNCFEESFPSEIRSVGIDALRNGDWFDDGFAGMYVFDGGTAEQLDELAGQLDAQDLDRLLIAGPAGISRRLPLMLGHATTPFEVPAIPQPALVVAGSITPKTHAQLRHGLARGALGLKIEPEMLLPSDARPGDFWKERARDAAERGVPVLLYGSLDADETVAFALRAAELRIGPETLPGRILDVLTHWASRLFENPGFPTVALFGGETAYAFLDAHAVSSADVVGELFPGVNLLAFGKGEKTIHLITKSGGFGPDKLLDLFFP